MFITPYVGLPVQYADQGSLELQPAIVAKIHSAAPEGCVDLACWDGNVGAWRSRTSIQHVDAAPAGAACWRLAAVSLKDDLPDPPPAPAGAVDDK